MASSLNNPPKELFGEKFVFTLSLWSVSAALAPPTSFAAESGAYPNKAIRLIVPFPPGGGTDLVARTAQPAVTAALGQQLLIDNRGGAKAPPVQPSVPKSTPTATH